MKDALTLLSLATSSYPLSKFTIENGQLTLSLLDDKLGGWFPYALDDEDYARNATDLWEEIQRHHSQREPVETFELAETLP